MTRYVLRAASGAICVATLLACPLLAGEPAAPCYLAPGLTTARPAAATPMRLPPIEVLMFESSLASTPFLFTPIANLNLDEFRTAPEVKLGIGQPNGEKPSIGGWISFGGGAMIAQ